MYSVKTNVLELTALMKQHGITRAVLSPGSRNSPLTRWPPVRTYSVHR